MNKPKNLEKPNMFWFIYDKKILDQTRKWTEWTCNSLQIWRVHLVTPTRFTFSVMVPMIVSYGDRAKPLHFMLAGIRVHSSSDSDMLDKVVCWCSHGTRDSSFDGREISCPTQHPTCCLRALLIWNTQTTTAGVSSRGRQTAAPQNQRLIERLHCECEANRKVKYLKRA